MKVLSVLLIILVAILGLGCWSTHSLQTSSNELVRQIDDIGLSIENNHWGQAQSQTRRLERTWQQKSTWWAVILDHQEIDNIEFSLAKAREYVAVKNPALSRGQLSELRLMVRHIPSNESVNLKNLL
jgi:hypothetical protein